MSSPLNIWDAFCLTAERFGPAPALLTQAQAYEFGELRRRAEDYRQLLLGRGLAPQDRVLLNMRNGFEMLAALLGVWGAGGIPAIIDSSCRSAQRRQACETVQPRFYISVDPIDATELADNVIGLRCADVPRDAAAHLRPIRDALPTDPASIVFTSGSTGRPKGVVQSHGNILRGARTIASYSGFAEGDRLLCPVPWAFDYGFVQLHQTIICGLTQVVIEQANPFTICEAIGTHRPQVLAGTPSLYTFLLRGLSPLPQTDVSSLRILTSSGGTIPPSIRSELLDRFSEARIVLNYGLTETYRTAFLDPALVHTHADTIGRPIPGVDVVVVDDRGLPLPAGEVGEIVHRGDYICLGYWGDDAATQRAVRPDPCLSMSGAALGRALFTGDYGFIDIDGFLHFRGRRDHQLKSMGVRVSPSEVESLLFSSGMVHEVAVFGIEHDMLGHEVWAAVVINSESEAGVSRLQAYVRETMSPYMQPRRWLRLEHLPRTVTGKVDYPELRRAAAAQPSRRITE